jgi:RNA 3'-terminal phosphate cyclase (ATP)
MKKVDVHIDGSHGEGGGQVLRTALGLSLATGRSFRMEHIRAGRKKPGLMRQHLTAVKAAARIGQAQVEGAELGSQTLHFTPSTVKAGDYHFSIGTAGSAMLVLQTVLPALARADGPSRLCIEGGTHAAMAPPFEYIERVFLPLLRRMGPTVYAVLKRPGFYPMGGGRVEVEITPASVWTPLDLRHRGAHVRSYAEILVAHVPPQVALREKECLLARLPLREDAIHVVERDDSVGPGNAVLVTMESEEVTEVFTGFGKRGVHSSVVVSGLAQEYRAYAGTEVPVGPHLADQLLVPFALAGGGSFRTMAPTRHTQTNMETIQHFLDIHFEVTQKDKNDYTIRLRPEQ